MNSKIGAKFNVFEEILIEKIHISVCYIYII